MIRSLFAAAAILVVGVTTASAQPIETSQQAVMVRGLDTTNASDIQTLLGRLERASLDVCGAPSGSDHNYVATVRSSECFTSALGGAVAAAHIPALDRAYAADQHQKPIHMAAR